MTRIPRASGRRLAALLALGAVLAWTVAGPSTAVATTAPDAATISAAETAMVRALNADRTSRGLVAVQPDSRLMAIARARSADMVANHYFSHTQPDGRNVFDILTGQSIAWYNAGEIIAWNTYGIADTVAAGNRQWMNSAGHKAIIVSTNFNYVGVGLAVEAATGKNVWTAVFIKGPDRTPARAAVSGAPLRAGPSDTTRYARVTWSGYDPRLQVLTAGLDTFTIQKNLDGAGWVTIVSSTRLTYTNFTLALGHRYEFRIAARDKRGNLGAWSTKVIDLR